MSTIAPTPRDPAAAHRHRRRHGLGFWSVAFAFLVVMAFSTVPSPLYGIYQERDGFSSFVITLIYAGYAVGVVGSLLLADLPVGKRDAPTGGDRHEQLIVSVVQAEGVFGIDEPPEVLGRGGLIGGDRILESGGNHGGRLDHAVSRSGAERSRHGRSGHRGGKHGDSVKRVTRTHDGFHPGRETGEKDWGYESSRDVLTLVRRWPRVKRPGPEGFYRVVRHAGRRPATGPRASMAA